MNIANFVLPILSSLASLACALFVFRRFAGRKGLHLLVWGIGILMFGIGSASEAYYTALGWSPTVFRLWYLFGAILVAAWLGQGTLYLMVRKSAANVLLVILLVASIYGAIRVFTADLDPTLLTSSATTGSELSGHAIITPGVRILTPFFNVYGTVILVGGALWSALMFWRKRIMLHRTFGNILIAAGAILPAAGGTLSRMGVPNALYIGELLGVTLIFLGFLRSTTPMKRSGVQEETD
jgi:hypothetical protein